MGQVQVAYAHVFNDDTTVVLNVVNDERDRAMTFARLLRTLSRLRVLASVSATYALPGGTSVVSMTIFMGKQP